ncbi:MAG: hypothetical protein KJ971_02680 [Firmicutes bacterium]|nr:hypothetical protein [Bacillota bacterium]
MYYRIENEFKKNSWYKRDLNFILILSVSYTVLSIFLSTILGSIWYSYGLALLIVPSQYTYIFFIVRKFNNHEAKYFEVKSNVQSYIDERKSRDAKMLAEICKKNSINTRPKVLEAIKHYQTLLPRNIIGSGVFLSLVAIIISIAAFSFNENNTISSERFQFMMTLFLLVGILYAFFKFTVNQFASSFGTKALYRRMEEILSTIYFQSIIK